MRNLAFSRFGLLVCGLALFATIAVSQQTVRPVPVPSTARVESITFEGLSVAEQAAIRKQLSLQVGDTFSAEARQRMAAELKSLAANRGLTLTFAYEQGTKSATAAVRIQKGC